MKTKFYPLLMLGLILIVLRSSAQQRQDTTVEKDGAGQVLSLRFNKISDLNPMSAGSGLKSLNKSSSDYALEKNVTDAKGVMHCRYTQTHRTLLSTHLFLFNP